MNEKIVDMIKWVLDITLIMILSFIYYLNEPVSSPRVIYIPKGSLNNIISQMQQSGYNVSKMDSLILRSLGSLQSGWIDVEEGVSTKGDFLYRLVSSKAAMKNITLIPGETTHIFFNMISAELGLDRNLLQKEYDSVAILPEGMFMPNTYALPIGLSEKVIVKILLNQSMRQMNALSMKIFSEFDEKKWFHFVTIASIIQKESASIEEMPLVSSVIYNRLKQNMRLQMDGTLNYGEFSHTKVTASRIKEDESSYNTYKIMGLPRYPVCTVSVEAIKAAIFPAKTSYLYFVKNKNGTHDFSCNYSTHLSNINK